MMQAVARKVEEQEIMTRLQNWGNWSRQNPLPRLGFPSSAAGFAKSASKGILIAVRDAEWIDDIINMLYKMRPGTAANYIPEYERWPMYAVVMKLDYAEHSIHEVPHVSQRAHDLRKMFSIRCAERTYNHHGEKAREIISAFSCELR
jgi:hypothetical protein